MLPTAEVRWFGEGPVPPELRGWFQRRGPGVVAQPRRVDFYLHLPDTDSLGVKLREGRIELKQRQRQFGVVPFPGRAAGLVEHWRKWSFGLAAAEAALVSAVASSTAWIGVSKERGLHRYQVTEGGEVVAASGTGFPGRGCDLELTRIRVGAREWWSLGLEVFGEESTLHARLLLVAGRVLAAGPSLGLDERDSFGYPAWLRMVVPGGSEAGGAN
jgi:hypothetical protein